MILDSIANAQRYYALVPELKSVVDFLHSTDVGALTVGRHDIDGDRLYVNVAEEPLRAVEQAPLEVHNRYIDVQVLLTGEESFGWRHRPDCIEPRAEFDEERDILFYSDAPATLYTLHAGQFTILFPEDAHAPLIGSGRVRKLIFKLMLQ